MQTPFACLFLGSSSEEQVYNTAEKAKKQIKTGLLLAALQLRGTRYEAKG